MRVESFLCAVLLSGCASPTTSDPLLLLEIPREVTGEWVRKETHPHLVLAEVPELQCTIPVKLSGEVEWISGESRSPSVGGVLIVRYSPAELIRLQAKGYYGRNYPGSWSVDFSMKFNRGGKTEVVDATSTCSPPSP